ncbi:MAG: CopG family transcriptional regulator [Chloroflexi bacterium]|nr:CopG family transcriptional regulator [Chloroflexota bacterium]
MKAISLKLPDEVVSRSDEYAETLSISRAEYIRRAIEHMNKEIEDVLRANRIKKASQKVREESMRINAEFDAIEEDPDA